MAGQGLVPCVLTTVPFVSPRHHLHVSFSSSVHAGHRADVVDCVTGVTLWRRGLQALSHTIHSSSLRLLMGCAWCQAGRHVDWTARGKLAVLHACIFGGCLHCTDDCILLVSHWLPTLLFFGNTSTSESAVLVKAARPGGRTCLGAPSFARHQHGAWSAVVEGMLWSAGLLFVCR